MNIGGTIFAMFFLMVALILVVMGVKSVPQGRHYTVERFGRYQRTLTPGLNIIMPFFDLVSNKVDMREQVLDVPTQEVITEDNAIVEVDGVVFYQVVDAKDATYEINDLRQAVLDLITTNIRAAMGSMKLDDLLSKREEIGAALLHDVDDSTERWGVKVFRVKIKDINPPKDLVDAMARQLKADRDKRAAILTAEGERQAAINRAEGEKRSVILRAEGEKEAMILRAQAEHEAAVMEADYRKIAAIREAEGQERLAEAQARATAMLSRAINEGNIQAVNYYVAEKYVAALQTLASSGNEKLVFMPLESASVIGALGGIGEIARDALGKNSRDNDGRGEDNPPPRAGAT